MTTLDADFERNLHAALMDKIEARIRELGELFKEVAEDAFKAYAARNGYDIDHVWEDAELAVERGRNSVTARIEWPGLTALFEWGVEPHVIRGSPLAFRWEGPPAGTRPPGAPPFVVSDEVNWGSVTGGIPEARAIREARDRIRNELVTR